jgi:nucleolar complex protein 3
VRSFREVRRLLIDHLRYRSKKELERLHQLYKPARVERKTDDLPAVDSGSEEYSDTESLPSNDFSDKLSENVPISEDEEEYSVAGFDSDAEMPYEQVPWKQRSRDGVSSRTKQIEGLPIKLPDGTIQKSTKMLLVTDSDLSSNEESEEESVPRESETRVEDVTTGARFGRAAIVDIVGKSSRKERVEAAKEQIAGICQDILADPENSVCEHNRYLTPFVENSII